VNGQDRAGEAKSNSIPAPFFAARYRDGQTTLSGVADCLIGRKLPGPEGGPPDGLFVEWRWDNDTLVARNDRYGFWPLFYASINQEIRISTSITQVLQGNVPRDLDYAALAVLLRMGHPVGDDTPFTHVRSLPPGSTLTWTRGQLQIDAPELPVRTGDYAPITFDDAVDEFAKLFSDAISKRMPDDEDIEFPLSGGRDSRHILLALQANGFLPKRCVTLEYRPPTTNEDVRVARLLANAIGLEHRVVERAPSWFETVVREVKLTNFCGGSHAWILPLADYLEKHTSTLYDGLAGSVLSGGFMTDSRKLELYRSGQLEDLARILLSEGGRSGFLDTLLARSFQHCVAMDAAVARLVTELRRHAEASNPMLSFIFWNRTRRGVSQIPLSIMASVPVVHCPYMDHAVYDFLVSVDPAYFLGNRLHDEVIRRSYPKFAHLPYEDQTLRADYQRHDHQYYKRSMRELGAYLARRAFKPSGVLRKESLYPRILRDLLKSRAEIPWYLILTVYCLELEEQSASQ